MVTRGESNHLWTTEIHVELSKLLMMHLRLRLATYVLGVANFMSGEGKNIKLRKKKKVENVAGLLASKLRWPLYPAAAAAAGDCPRPARPLLPSAARLALVLVLLLLLVASDAHLTECLLLLGCWPECGSRQCGGLA